MAFSGCCDLSWWTGRNLSLLHQFSGRFAIFLIPLLEFFRLGSLPRCYFFFHAVSSPRHVIPRSMWSHQDFKALIVHLHINRGMSFREIAALVSVTDGDVPIRTSNGEYTGVSKTSVERYVRCAPDIAWSCACMLDAQKKGIQTRQIKAVRSKQGSFLRRHDTRSRSSSGWMKLALKLGMASAGEVGEQ